MLQVVDLTANRKGLTSMRIESMTKKRMLDIKKGNFFQMMIAKLIKKFLWISFCFNGFDGFDHPKGKWA